MSKETTTVNLNGQLYDAVTGLPVSDNQQTARQASHVPHANRSTSIDFHARPQRSVTLHRKVTHRPTPAKHQIINSHVRTRVAEVNTHPQIKKFAAHPVGAVKPNVPAQKTAQRSHRMMDIGPVVHPHVAKAHALATKKSLPQKTPSAVSIKERAIKNAIEKTHKKPPLRNRWLPRQKLVGVLSALIALVLFGGYLTYLNMPNLSVRVAAIQAGIDADFPSYNPDGYSLNGPVKYTDGSVTLSYKANGGPHKYAVNQSRSSWNSDAVLDNYVSPRAGTNYIPYTERGLVIYTYGNNAAWVNGGVFYTIEGDAPLSSEQIRRIATSLL